MKDLIDLALMIHWGALFYFVKHLITDLMDAWF